MDFPVVGYGPFVLTDFKTNQYAEMTANKDFFLGAPHYDKVVTNYYSNSDAAAAALTSGELDQIGGLTPAQFKAMSSRSNMMTYQTQSSGWTAIEINPGARDPQRKADGNGQPDPQGHPGSSGDRPRASTGRSWSPRCWTATASSEPATCRPATRSSSGSRRRRRRWTTTRLGPSRCSTRPVTRWARTACGSAPDGKPLQFRLGIHSDDATDAAIAPYLKEWMTAIGIKLDVNAMSFDQLNNNLAKGDWDILMDGWSTGPDPTYLLSIQTCGTLPDGRTARTATPTRSSATSSTTGCTSSSRRSSTRSSGRRRSRRCRSILYAGNADLILFYKNGLARAAHRPGDRTTCRATKDGQRVLPAAARLHQLVEGRAGGGRGHGQREGERAELQRHQVDRSRRAGRAS